MGNRQKLFPSTDFLKPFTKSLVRILSRDISFSLYRAKRKSYFHYPNPNISLHLNPNPDPNLQSCPKPKPSRTKYSFHWMVTWPKQFLSPITSGGGIFNFTLRHVEWFGTCEQKYIDSSFKKYFSYSNKKRSENLRDSLSCCYLEVSQRIFWYIIRKACNYGCTN